LAGTCWLREAGGRELRARPFGRALIVVCGDDVRCSVDSRHDEVHVVEVLARRTALYRANQRGGAEPVVANLTRLLVVLAPAPGTGSVRRGPLPWRRPPPPDSPPRWS